MSRLGFIPSEVPVKTLIDQLNDAAVVVKTLGIEEATSLTVGSNYDVPGFLLWAGQLAAILEKAQRRFYDVSVHKLEDGYVVVFVSGREWKCQLSAASVPADQMAVIKRLLTELAPVAVAPEPAVCVPDGSTVSHDVVAERGDVVAVCQPAPAEPVPAVDDDDRPW